MPFYVTKQIRYNSDMKVAHSPIAVCATFLFLPHFDVICDLLLKGHTARWNLFVKYNRPKEKQAYSNYTEPKE